MDCRHFFSYGKGSLFTKKLSHYHDWWSFQKNQPFASRRLPWYDNRYGSKPFTPIYFLVKKWSYASIFLTQKWTLFFSLW